MNWPLALVICAFLFVGGCALWIQAAADSTEEFIDYAERSFCYDTGYADARYGNDRSPPREGGDACAGFYADGYGDGEDGDYNPPQE